MIEKTELTMDEVKALLNVGEEGVKSLLKRGKLEAVRHYRRGKAGNTVTIRNFTLESVSKYLRDHENRVI